MTKEQKKKLDAPNWFAIECSHIHEISTLKLDYQ